MEDFSKVPPLIIDHLKKVYLTLFCCMITSAFGAYFHPGGLTMYCLFIEVVWMLEAIEKQKKWMRFVVFMAAAFCGGASLCPFVSFIFKIDKSNVITLLMQTALPFGCLSGAALLKDSIGAFYFHEMIYASIYLVMMWNLFDGSLSWWRSMKMLFLLPLQILRVMTHAKAIVRRARSNL